MELKKIEVFFFKLVWVNVFSVFECEMFLMKIKK